MRELLCILYIPGSRVFCVFFTFKLSKLISKDKINVNFHFIIKYLLFLKKIAQKLKKGLYKRSKE